LAAIYRLSENSLRRIVIMLKCVGAFIAAKEAV
jgi:hypothetical protein